MAPSQRGPTESEGTQPRVEIDTAEHLDEPPRLPTREEDADALVKRCLRELAEGPEPLRAARLHYEIATMCETLLGDAAKAADHYGRAAALMPEHAPTLRGARRGLIAARRFKEALALFDKEVRVTAEQRGRARLLYAKGRLLEDQVADLDAALEAFRAALELAPDDLSLLKAIERCERRAESWPELSRTWEKTARLVTDSAHRAAIVAERARLAELRSGDPEQAAQLHLAALDVDPSAPASLSTLKRLTRTSRDWREFVNALRREHKQATSPRARADALQLVSDVLSARLGDLDAAISAMEEAVEYVPDDRDLRRRLADLYQSAGRWEDLATTLMGIVETSPGRGERIALCQRIARLLEDQLRDQARARRWYEIALELDPTFRPVLQSLAKLYERTQDWESLITILHKEAATADEPERKATAHARIAEVLEYQLGRPDDAATEHARVLGWMPGHEPAFKALIRLHAAAGRWLELIEVLQRAVDHAPDDERTVAFLFRIGAIQEDQLGDHAGAVHAYARILELEPGNLGAIHALQRAAERALRYRELVEALDLEAGLSDNRARVVSLRYFAAEVLEDHLEEPEGAIRRLKQVLELDRTHLPALTALGRLYHQAGRWEDLLENRKALLHVTSQGPASVDLLFEMGELCRTKLGREADAIVHYRRALDLDAGHEPAHQALRRVLTTRCAWDELGKLLELRVGTRKDPFENARLAMELGELYEEHARKADKALEAYEKALVAVPGHRPALDARIRLLTEKQSWKALEEDVSREAVGVPNEALSIDAKLRQGEVLANRLNDLKGAVRCYEWVLEHAPGHVGALLALEDLHLRLRHRDQLAIVYDQLSVALADPGAKVAALREVARIACDGKGDTELAASAYGRILELVPDDEEALTALLTLSAPASQVRLGLEARLASVAKDPAVIAYHQTRVAEVLEASPGEEALGAYRAALALDPDSLTAVRGFTRMARRSGSPQALREAGHREARVTKDVPLAVELLLESAEARRRAGHREEAVEDVEKAIELDPEHEGAARALRDTLFALGHVPRLLELLGRAAENAKRPDRVAALHTEVGRLHFHVTNNLPGAVASLERALRALSGSVEALELLAECLERAERWREAADALRKLVRLSKSDAARLDANLRLAAITDERLGAQDEAQKCLDAVLQIDPDNRQALGRLARIHAREGRRDEALALSRRLADAARSPDERAAALVEVARIEQALGHEQESAKALEEAVAMLGPESDAAEAYRQMIAQASPYAAWDPYLGALLRHLDLAQRTGRSLATTYLAMAEVFGDRLNRADRAFSMLRDGIARLPDDPRLSLELATRLGRVSAHDKVIEEVRRLVGRRVDVPEAYRRLSASLRSLGQEAEAVAALAPLQIVGGATPDEVLTIKARRIRAAMARPGLLGDAGFREIQAAGSHDAPASALLAALAEPLKKLHPTDLGPWGVSKRDRLRAGADHPIRVAADRVAAILGVEEVDLYVHDVEAPDVVVQLGSPPALFVPAWARQLSQSQLVFFLSRPLANVVREVHPVDRLPAAEVAALLVAAARMVSPSYGRGLASEGDIEDAEQALARAMPRRSRPLVQEAAARLVPGGAPDLVAWVAAVRRTASRAALLLSDDVTGSVEVLARIEGREALGEEAMELVRFWISDTALRFRRAAAQNAA